mgnify:CR=1 FL=1
MKDFLKFTFATITGIIVSVVVLVSSVFWWFSAWYHLRSQKRKYAKTPL